MSEERRHFFRCQTDLEHENITGTLHAHRGDLTVKLQNRSSGGFGVVLADGKGKKPELKDELVFSTSGYTYLVRVAHLTEKPEGLVLGLEILRELPVSAQRKSDRSDRRAGSSLLTWCAVAVCVAVVAINAPWKTLLKGTAGGGDKLLSATDVTGKLKWQLLPDEKVVKERKLASNYVALDYLRSHRAIAHLDLSLPQQQEIGRIVKETSVAMEAIFRERETMTDPEWAELGLQLIQATAQRIEGQLTPEQRARWNDVLAQNAGR